MHCKVNAVKTLKFEKGRGCMTLPPGPMVAPPLIGGRVLVVGYNNGQ